jgi:hypothetical protein
MIQFCNRRRFLGRAAAIPLAVKAIVTPGKVSMVDQPARCVVLDPKGDPVPAEQLQRFHICDLLSRPIPIKPELGSGQIVFQPAPQPFRISLPLAVPGFGQVFLYADHHGEGHTR